MAYISKWTKQQVLDALVVMQEGCGFIIGIRQEQADGSQIAVFGDTYRMINPPENRFRDPLILTSQLKEGAGALVGRYFNSDEELRSALKPFTYGK